MTDMMTTMTDHFSGKGEKMLQEPINSENAPAARGPYSPALQIGDFIYISGQLPLNSETNQIVSDDIREQTKQCILNITALLKKVEIDLHCVFKVTIFLTDMRDLDGMNEVYAKMFRAPYPARSVVCVKELENHARIEMECFAMDTRALEVLCSQEEGDCSGNCCSL